MTATATPPATDARDYSRAYVTIYGVASSLRALVPPTAPDSLGDVDWAAVGQAAENAAYAIIAVYDAVARMDRGPTLDTQLLNAHNRLIALYCMAWSNDHPWEAGDFWNAVTTILNDLEAPVRDPLAPQKWLEADSVDENTDS